ncbi:MAG: copper resistance CopC/CopD family protein [Ilumatobacteraceae bacterium]
MRKVCRLTLLAVALSAFAVADGRVSAHSDFSGSEPEAGAIVDGPLTMVEMRFALPVQARPGFEILVDGGLVESFWEAFDAERTVWAGTTPDGLSGGTVTVTYAVTADDGHLIEGEIFFTVTAAEGTTVVPAETAAVTTTTPMSISPTTTIASTTMVAESIAPLSVATPRVGDRLEHLARAISLLGVVLVLGLSFFSFAVLRSGVPGPFARVVMSASALVGVSAVIELVAVADRLGLNAADAIGDPLARGPVIRLIFSVLVVLAGLAARVAPASSTVPLVGAVIGAVSFAFDGHAVTFGWRPLHAASSMAHVVTASVWVGSVIGLVLIGRQEPDVARRVIVRLGRLLPITVGAITLSGVAMVLMIHGWSLGLGDSEWGRTLIVKTSLVAVAGLLGLRHHLRGRRGASVAGVSLSAEAIVLVLVPVITAALVVAMP